MRKRRKLASATHISASNGDDAFAEGWMSAAGSFIVDGIVAALKKHPAPKFCWNRTGPSLRLLNKHWYREMNRHVVSIEVQNELPNGALKKLLKFPNLTSLTIWKQTIIKDRPLWIQTARGIPRLSYLSISLEMLKSIERDDLEGLVCKTVEVRQELGRVSVEELFKLAAIRMERLVIDWFGIEGWITVFLAAAPSVKRMTVRRLGSEDDFKAMAGLEELKLGYYGMHFDELATLSSLVELEAAVPVHTFEPFASFTRLRSLHILLRRSFVFDQSFYDVIRRLKQLVMAGQSALSPSLVLPRAFFESAAGLESLSLTLVVIDTDRQEWSSLSRLSHLNMHNCSFVGDMIPWRRVSSLTSLTMKSVSGYSRALISAYTDLSPLKMLRNLDLDFGMNDRTFVGMLLSIKRLTNLEYLTLPNRGQRVGVRDLVETVELLKKLPHLMDKNIVRDEILPFP